MLRSVTSRLKQIAQIDSTAEFAASGSPTTKKKKKSLKMQGGGWRKGGGGRSGGRGKGKGGGVERVAEEAEKALAVGDVSRAVELLSRTFDQLGFSNDSRHPPHKVDDHNLSMMLEGELIESQEGKGGGGGGGGEGGGEIIGDEGDVSDEEDVQNLELDEDKLLFDMRGVELELSLAWRAYRERDTMQGKYDALAVINKEMQRLGRVERKHKELTWRVKILKHITHAREIKEDRAATAIQRFRRRVTAHRKAEAEVQTLDPKP